MSEWKILLEQKKRKVKAVNKDERVANIAVILTSDAFQFILSEYEEVDEVKEKDDVLEINGKNYKQFGGNKTYHPAFEGAINSYLKSYKILSPSKDILTLKEASEYLIQIKELAEELYSLKGTKKLKK